MNIFIRTGIVVCCTFAFIANAQARGFQFRPQPPIAKPPIAKPPSPPPPTDRGRKGGSWKNDMVSGAASGLVEAGAEAAFSGNSNSPRSRPYEEIIKDLMTVQRQYDLARTQSGGNVPAELTNAMQKRLDQYNSELKYYRNRRN